MNTIHSQSALSIIKVLGGNTSTGMCCCPAHHDKKPSLHVSDGRKGPVWKCHAGCSNEAVTEALRARRIWPVGEASHGKRDDDQPPEVDDYRRLKRAWSILKAAARARAGQPLSYLAARGIDGCPPALMLLPAKECRRLLGKRYPAIVAPIVGSEGFQGAQVTLLDRKALGKLNTNAPRKTYGRLRGGWVPLGEADSDRPLVVAEGIETALAAAEIARLPAIATLSATNLKNVVPPHCSEVIICADNDGVGIKAAKALSRKLLDDGHKVVRIAVPDNENSDWNDALNSGTDLKTLRRSILNAPPVKDRGVRAVRSDRLLRMDFAPPQHFLHPIPAQFETCEPPNESGLLKDIRFTNSWADSSRLLRQSGDEQQQRRT